MPAKRLPLAIICAWAMTEYASVSAADAAPGAKPRLVVMTDIGGDPDDEQSIVRFLLYACDFEVEGLCTGFGHGHYKITRPDLLHKAVDAYGQDLPNLHQHRPDYPSHGRLKSLVKDGHNGDPHTVGPGMDSEASDWIVQVLDRDDPRPVWFTIWGGPRELAQAIWKVQTTRSADDLARFKAKIRVHSIADQDRTALWVKEHHPDVFWIYSKNIFRGIWKEGDQDLVSPEWLEEHVRIGHGPLGAIYPAKASGKVGVKEGDTPAFFYVLPNGLSDPEHPEWGNWGGRFQPSGHGREYLPAEDLRGGQPDLLYTLHRWRQAYQNEFQTRMDWCVRPRDKANHEPVAVLDGDPTRKVLQRELEPGKEVRFSAAGSFDPDGDSLTYRWWIYVEAGSYWTAPPITDSDAAEASLTVPRDASGRTFHVILEVSDRGTPPLLAYRRLILQVRGKAVAPPASAIPADLRAPVTRLEGPSTETGPWRFWRAVNLNGPAIQIDGQAWEGDDAPDFQCTDKPLASPQVPLQPPTDAARAEMIHTSRWSRSGKAMLTAVPPGTYAIYAYFWEDTRPTVFSVRVNGRQVEKDHQSGPAGRWRRLGPWITDVKNGVITIEPSGGDANLSGIEIWQRAANRE